MERRRTLGSEVMEMGKEWKLLKTLASSDVNSNNEISITTDNDGNPFSVNEIYMRIYKCERQVASYNGISIGKNKTIGELRGNFPMEVFIKNVAGFLEMFLYSVWWHLFARYINVMGCFPSRLCSDKRRRTRN